MDADAEQVRRFVEIIHRLPTESLFELLTFALQQRAERELRERQAPQSPATGLDPQTWGSVINFS